MGDSVPQNNSAIWELSLHPILCSEQPSQPISGEPLEAASECCALREFSTCSPHRLPCLPCIPLCNPTALHTTEAFTPALSPWLWLCMEVKHCQKQATGATRI